MRQSSSRRRGMTMLHMIISMTLVSILVASAAVVITRIMDAELVMRRDAQWTTIAVQLDEIVRNDTHRSITVEAVDNELQLLTPDGQRIIYQLQATDLSNTMRRLELDSNGERTMQDSYRLPFKSETTWARRLGPNGQSFVEFKITTAKNAIKPPRRIFHVVTRIRGVPQ